MFFTERVTSEDCQSFVGKTLYHPYSIARSRIFRNTTLVLFCYRTHAWTTRSRYILATRLRGTYSLLPHALNTPFRYRPDPIMTNVATSPLVEGRCPRPLCCTIAPPSLPWFAWRQFHRPMPHGPWQCQFLGILCSAFFNSFVTYAAVPNSLILIHRHLILRTWSAVLNCEAVIMAGS